MAAPVWDALSKLANIAQLTGFNPFMLVDVADRVLRISCNKRAGDKLDKAVSNLRVLLHQPVPYTGGEIIRVRYSQIWLSAAETVEAARILLEEYRSSTLWVRVSTGRGMSLRLAEMHHRVESSHCWLVLSIYGHFEQMHGGAPIVLPPPAPDETAIAIDNHEVNRAQELTRAPPFCPAGEGTCHVEIVLI